MRNVFQIRGKINEEGEIGSDSPTDGDDWMILDEAGSAPEFEMELVAFRSLPRFSHSRGRESTTGDEV